MHQTDGRTGITAVALPPIHACVRR